MSLREKVLSGVKWTTLSSAINTLFQILQLAILTHYLSSSDFGLMAIVYVIIGFSALFMDMGISAAIIHKQHLSHEQLSSLYWLNVFAGVFLFLVVYMIAPFIADFYHQESLVVLIRLLALTFVMNAFASQYKLLLQKELKFNILSKISILTVFTSLLLATILAINDFGIYSLVYAALGSSFFNTVVFLSMGMKEHRPSFIFNYRAIRFMITFGLFQMADRSITYFNSQFDVILIGKLLGVEALGIYSIAKNLSLRPAKVINPIITRVTFPVMSKLQDDTQKLRSIYLKTINYLSTVNFFIYILMAVLAEPIILILFGHKWEESIDILRILAFYGAIRSTGNPQGTLLLSKGKADLSFYLNLGKFFIMVAVIYIGSHWGLIGVAWSLLLLTTGFIFPNWYIVVRPLSGATLRSYLLQIVRPFLISISGALFGELLCYMIGIDNIYLKGIIITGIMGLFFYVLNHRYNREFLQVIVDLLKRKRK